MREQIKIEIPEHFRFQKVLDHGFVRYIDHMGSDESIVEAARQSTTGAFVSWDPYARCKTCGRIVEAADTIIQRPHGPECDGVNAPLIRLERGDLGMLEHMYSGGPEQVPHGGPFEMGDLIVQEMMPIFCFRQRHRHRTFSYNEFSGRYSEMMDLYYQPSPERLRAAAQDYVNRQGSKDGFQNEIAAGQILLETSRNAREAYEQLLKLGLAKELSRILLPLMQYSRQWAKANLRNWLFSYFRERLAPNAQWEMRQFAQANANLVTFIWPRTWFLFEEYTRYAVTFSRSEMAWLKTFAAEFSGTIKAGMKAETGPLALPDAMRRKLVKKLDLGLES